MKFLKLSTNLDTNGFSACSVCRKEKQPGDTFCRIEVLVVPDMDNLCLCRECFRCLFDLIDTREFETQFIK